MDCSKSRHIPAEILEEILLKLAVKPLVRFSSVSRSWNVMINESRQFSKRYRGGRQRIILRSPESCRFESFPLPTAASLSNEIEAAAAHPAFKFHQYFPMLRAVCDGLCFIEYDQSVSMFLWNPSNGTFHKLPHSPEALVLPDFALDYGLGYDPVGDDYKLLRIAYNYESLLYSLESNSWRKIQSFPKMDENQLKGQKSRFVSGALHWLFYHHQMSRNYVILSFDLSTEEYGEVALPPEYTSMPKMHAPGSMEMVVLRGKVCLSINYYGRRIEGRFVLMVMEDYGVRESWTKKFDIKHHVFASVRPILTPLCTCDDDDDAIYVTSWTAESWVVLKNKDSGDDVVLNNTPQEITKRPIYKKWFGFVYTESLVSPAALVSSQENTSI